MHSLAPLLKGRSQISVISPLGSKSASMFEHLGSFCYRAVVNRFSVSFLNWRTAVAQSSLANLLSPATRSSAWQTQAFK
jgi:hypothetical protein